MTIDQRINALRKAMQKYGLSAYIVPSSDPHQSEYVADHWKSREWLTGFDGSAGILIVTEDHAGLWTDSRYFLQAAQQLEGSEVRLQKQETPHAPEHISWLVDQLPAGSDVGCDGFLFSLGQIDYLDKKLAVKHISIHAGLDLINDIWKDRPALPEGRIFEHSEGLAGKSRREKLQEIRQKIRVTGARHYLITTLDDIAWTLNLRGADIAFNPVFISYLLIGEENAILFVDSGKISDKIRSDLEKDDVLLRPYAALESFLEKIPSDEPVLIHSASLSYGLYQILGERRVFRGQNIPRGLKAIKNATEIKHIREVMVKDGVALVKLYRWLETILDTRSVTEYEVSKQLDHFRGAQSDYWGPSFSAIVGYNANGAIVHYRPEPETSANIRREGILLLDSGGQYLDGTTDITRTTAMGEPTEAQRQHFTLVLKGHIALARAKFPKGTTGAQLDTLARMHLWEQGLNYGHGTGHGVGFFLNVHEPPQGFAASAATSRGTTAIEPGMLTSNEPGFYKEGAYGIRIENLVLCIADEETDLGAFYRLETVTLFPIDIRLVSTGLLTQQEKDWLNSYHELVFDKLSPHLNSEEVAWLKRRCEVLN